MTSNIIKISNREIGVGKPVFIVADISSNHNKDLDIAINTVKAAKESGADAIKLQTYTPDTMTINIENDMFLTNHGAKYNRKTLYKLYQDTYIPWEWHSKLNKIAKDIGIILFSTPFDKTSVDFLEKMNNPAYKIASPEITDIYLIEYAASKGKPMIMSTGIATIQDIKDAIKSCKKMKNEQIAILKCTSAYPTEYKDANIQNIRYIKKKFQTIVGLSDHTLGIAIPIASVALGAKIIEKHFILDKKINTPDADFSLDPKEFRFMVKLVREVEESLGNNEYVVSEKMKNNRIFSRSLFAVNDIKKGDILSNKNIRSIRPGYGLHPKYLKDILGKEAIQDIDRGIPIKWKFIKK